MVEAEKFRKNDELENESNPVYRVMTWDGIVTKYHNLYLKNCQMVSFDHQRRLEGDRNYSDGVIKRAVIYEK
ncbi:hypothetical protein CWI38_0296p0030 [Hamiltosporidium tvaerminnensis]|uniref:Uncharacterized protein n=1 Tax=Hamiltosporidium tvaerminnensis TaxID=1176355 RepID=A0A4Q9LZR8_9MICR|nr:hypothetical protein CWI38_0296p0030 [Hamiltosporidium tvaerminnensis]